MAEITEVLMPQLGETVTEGTITCWLKQPGDTVAEDEDLFEVSTDKVDTTVPSAVAGVLVAIDVAEGETVAVGTCLARIGPPTEGAPRVEDPVAIEVAAGVEVGVAAGAPGGTTHASPPDPPTSPPSPAAAPTGAAGSPAPGVRGDRFLSPVVRRLVAEHRLDVSRIDGSGSGGRITRADVLRAAGVASPEAAVPEAAVPARAVGARDEVVALSPIRRRTAEHLTRSLATAAHTLVVMDADYSTVDEVREAEKDAFRTEEGFALSYLPFVARAVTLAVREFPHVNATVTDDALVVHHDVHLGLAVDLDFEGLIVPVVRDADTLSVRALARAMADLAARARARSLAVDDVTGGTFTLTNAGSYGTLLTAPIINQPQVAILSTDGVKMRPVAVALDEGGYGVAVHPMGNLALSFDHRAFDGAYASAFLARVVGLLEEHDWSAELLARPARPPAPAPAPEAGGGGRP